jgi:glycine betaine/proline transport system permease protein
MSWHSEFPGMDSDKLSVIRRGIDAVFRGFTREYGEAIERLFDPLRDLLIHSEQLLTQSPWPAVVLQE